MAFRDTIGLLSEKELLASTPATARDSASGKELVRVFSFASRPKRHTIRDALNIIEAGLFAFALTEYYEIKLSNIIGITSGFLPTFYFDPEGYAKIARNKHDSLHLIKDDKDFSVATLVPSYNLNLLRSQKILNKFPFFQNIIDENNYANLSQPIENESLLHRCQRILGTWQQWCEAGLPHIVSSLQALQRHVASKMKKPLLIDFETKQENGLSVEYQCEIYADHLYGAKLLEAWHNYLICVEFASRNPNYFLSWMKSLPAISLKNFGIDALEEIPRVHYIETPTERTHYLLQVLPGNIVINENIPSPKKSGDKIEIIYTLGRSGSTVPQFFGGLKKRGVINHSTFFAGEKVEGAGRMLLISRADGHGNFNWIIHEADDNSGHIKPNDRMSLNVLKRLQELGLNLKTIRWTSKWGTPGARDETAEIALARLTKEWAPLKTLEIRSKLPSAFLKNLTSYAEEGKLGSINDLIVTQSYKVTLEESCAVSRLIKEALENHLRLLRHDAAHPTVARQLAEHALQFLRNTGENSLELETELEVIIKRYDYNLRQHRHRHRHDHARFFSVGGWKSLEERSCSRGITIMGDETSPLTDFIEDYSFNDLWQAINKRPPLP